VTDWLAVCRDAAEAVRGALDDLPTRYEREPGVGAGEGGDETTAVDAAAEAAVVRRLEALAGRGTGFTLVSEELGERVFGDGGDGTRVVVDPIDGSMNAKRGIPFFSLSVAVASGPSMGDVDLGYVYDFGSGEEWTARRGEGAFLDGRPLDGPGPKTEVELLAFEATRTDLAADKMANMVGFAYRTRIMGSLALSLCHLAAGRLDAVVSLKPARSVDIAAAQLLLLERGFAVDLPEDRPFEAARLDVVARSRIVAAATPARCAELYSRLEGLSASR
jgi:myo-inositol-1(or 4)-monophosphatase